MTFRLIEAVFLTRAQVVLMLQVLVCGPLSGKKGCGSILDSVPGCFSSCDPNVVSARSCEGKVYSLIPETKIRSVLPLYKGTWVTQNNTHLKNHF